MKKISPVMILILIVFLLAIVVFVLRLIYGATTSSVSQGQWQTKERDVVVEGNISSTGDKGELSEVEVGSDEAIINDFNIEEAVDLSLPENADSHGLEDEFSTFVIGDNVSVTNYDLVVDSLTTDMLTKVQEALLTEKYGSELTVMVSSVQNRDSVLIFVFSNEYSTFYKVIVDQKQNNVAINLF